MSEMVQSTRQQLGVTAVFVALALLAGGLLYVLPLGFSARDAAIVSGLFLAVAVVQLVLGDSSF